MKIIDLLKIGAIELNTSVATKDDVFHTCQTGQCLHIRYGKA